MSIQDLTRHFAGLALGLALLQPGSAAAARCDPLTETQVRKNLNVASDAPQYATFAILANNAYPRSQPLPLPAGWVEVPEWRIAYATTGMALAVYEQRVADRLVQVAVAFRGTDERRDWVQNLVPFVREQIPPADRTFRSILARYEGLGVKVVATGHSLGGGLALHMAYLYPRVDAIVFNSSPVTKAGPDPLSHNKRISIWESGEIVQAVRNGVSFSRPRWLGTDRVEVRFLHGSPLKQHDMEGLALNLIKLGARTSDALRAVLALTCPA